MNFISSIIYSYRSEKLAHFCGKAKEYETLCVSLKSQYSDLQKLAEKHFAISEEDSHDRSNGSETGIYWLNKNYANIVSQSETLQRSIAEAEGQHTYWLERYNRMKKLCGDE